MGINITCPNGHELNVKVQLAGKRGICPRCGAKFIISGQRDAFAQTATAPPKKKALPAVEAAKSSAKAEAVADPIAAEPEALWFVRPAKGGQFGPATARLMRQWIAEGRVTAESFVWRDGWTDWRAAANLFPHLAGSSPSHPAAAGNPADEPTANQATTDVLDLNLSIDTGPNSVGRRAARHRRSRQSSVVGLVILLSLAAVILLAILIYVLVKS